MTTLPPHIKERFYRTIKGDISLHEFEQWLYVDNELERHLNPDDYLDLISLSFKKSGAKYELWHLLKTHIDLGEFETYKMFELLHESKKKTEQLPYILMEFYDLYCRGYYFLEDLGIGFGLAVEIRVWNTSADTWDELTSDQQKELLDSFSPSLEGCIEETIYWLENQKIILTGEENEMGRYVYKDLRTEDERKSKLWDNPTEKK